MGDVYILFGSAVAVMFLALVTLFVVVSYFKTLKRERELEEEVKLMRSQGSEEARKLILNAQVQATEVIKNAQLKAQELINASEIFSKEYRQNFQAGFKEEIIKMLSSMSKTINSQVEAEVKGFHGTFESSMAATLKEAQTEIEGYKKMMFERVNSAIFAIVDNVTKKVLKESLSREQHERAITKALEEAKKQNVF
jgi:F0F1-type ATP synthase membrane subunit b/b'